MKLQDKIYIAGHRGLVGSAFIRRLKSGGYINLLTRSHAELDLTNQTATEAFFEREKPDYVLLAAAKVGGIHANATYPAEFIYTNLVIQTNVIHAAWRYGVKRLLFLGSSCIYPRDCPQPMKEEYLLTGPLEPTNRPYALAKIAGIEMCWAYNRQYGTRFMTVMPTNLYGQNDNYDLNNSHVLPAMIRKLHLAKLAQTGDLDGINRDEAIHGPIPTDLKVSLFEACNLSLVPHPLSRESEVVLWGTGMPRREFLYSDDMAEACLYLLEQPEEKLQPLFSNKQPPLVNVGCGEDLTICELAELIRDVVGFTGRLTFDAAKPDGTMQKLLEVSKLRQLGWKAKTSLRDGIVLAYEGYLKKSAIIASSKHGLF
ncbi:MAG TPA: GDP-fucose synthetase [Desulfobulbaceae bacterium]|nr:MAG: GDP-fucose synthetase [Deltaproteobacteria bacterium RIFOXYD12_FULL_53_23]HCC54584.1 GDP-fucose synthetase [Desulfobulbaceae bacterium]